MVLSLKEYELATRSDNMKIRQLFEARNTSSSFYQQCGTDREVQKLLNSPLSREYKYNNFIIHNPVKCGKQGPVTGPGSSIVPPHFRTKIDIRRQKMASSAVKPPVLPDSRTIRNESKNFQPINIQPFTMMQRCKSTGDLTEATGMRASSEELPVYENKYPSAPATNSEIQSFEVEKENCCCSFLYHLFCCCLCV
ncbi:uncharacterized protein LOC136028907 isoform X2 [Artemia franciscana]|uniref:uncharacterized protein LOC136028907 isoform X2 n=1 Tax=Artemia franciscana TaxID=6661 RepID=UPI0032DABA54